MNKGLSRLVGVLFVCWFLGVAGLRQYFTLYRPEYPQVEQGRTIPIDANYWKTVFVTPSEKKISDLMYWSALVPVGLCAGYFVVLVYKGVRKKE